MKTSQSLASSAEELEAIIERGLIKVLNGRVAQNGSGRNTVKLQHPTHSTTSILSNIVLSDVIVKRTEFDEFELKERPSNSKDKVNTITMSIHFGVL